MKKKSQKRSDALEITSFKLRGRTCAEFVAANADVDAWLKCQPGFRHRRIVQLDDGTVFDILLWASAEAGRTAMSRLMQELADSPVHGMIDQRTVSWNIAPVSHWISS